MSRFVEKYYSVSELAWTFSFSESSIRQWLKAGEFGAKEAWLIHGQDLRIPTSGVLFFVDNHLNRHATIRDEANRVKGRNLGEARRRLVEHTEV